MNHRLWITIPLSVLSLAGAYISSLLLDKHLLKVSGPAWFAAGCGEAPTAESASSQPAEPPDAESGSASPTRAAPGGRDCAAVLANRWATLPPSSDVPPESIDAGSIQHPSVRIPVAFIGMVYFVSLAIWFLFIGRPTPDKPEWYRLPLAFVIGGILFSVLYLALMFLRMDEWCPWCLVTHAINFLILGGMLLLRPARVSGHEAPASPQVATGLGPEHSATSHPSALTPHSSHPSGRLVAASLFLCVATGAMFWNGYAVAVVQSQKEVVQDYLKKFIGDAHFLTSLYYSKPEVKIAVRDDDPQTSRDETFCRLVVFSDFQCPACRSFAALVEKRLQSRFQNHLRVVWKHYPLSNECNPHAKRNTHPDSCRAARAAEAARMQGGDDAFWKAHDRLFAAQQRLKDFDYPSLARDLGLDPERFIHDMDSAAVTQRIIEDVEQAKALGVTGTPGIFLVNRPVDGMLAKVGAFWDLVAVGFNYEYDEKTYGEKMKKLEREGKLPPTTTQQDDHAGHGHD